MNIQSDHFSLDREDVSGISRSLNNKQNFGLINLLADKASRSYIHLVWTIYQIQRIGAKPSRETLVAFAEVSVNS